MDREPLPRIIRFLETLDCGPGAQCPHCGATGRWILRFVVEGGATRAAMRGCAKLFPVSPLAREELRLREKEKRYEKQGWKLNRVDSEAIDAIEAYAAGQSTEAIAMALVNRAKTVNSSRFRRR